MTLNEIKASEAIMLKPADVADVLGCDPHSIRVQAREYPEFLGFPVIVIGNKTLIPRKGFLNFIGEGDDARGNEQC